MDDDPDPEGRECRPWGADGPTPVADVLKIHELVRRFSRPATDDDLAEIEELARGKEAGPMDDAFAAELLIEAARALGVEPSELEEYYGPTRLTNKRDGDPWDAWSDYFPEVVNGFWPLLSTEARIIAWLAAKDTQGIHDYWRLYS